MPRTGSIYALCDPDTYAVRYVGKTVHRPESRLNGHLLGAARKSNLPVGVWIRSLSVEPALRVLECDVPEDDLSIAEQRWIDAMRRQGAELTNVATARREV